MNGRFFLNSFGGRAMNQSVSILLRDLHILETMVDGLPAYLNSNQTKWQLKADMPPLTIGGCLMRFNRLGIMRTKLDPVDQAHYDMILNQYEQVLVEKVVRFEQRAHQELHLRLGEWTTCLRELPNIVNQFSNKADIRVVIDATVTAMEKRPYTLKPQIKKELTTLDRNLRSRWQTGKFIWDSVWQPAYPKDKYWWLYGLPTMVAVY
jgi:hypothetical protein